MWHDVLVEQIALAENVIRTIEDNDRRLASSRIGRSTSLTLYGASTGKPLRSAVFACLRCQPVLGS
jgi:hypothetical protein